MHSTFADMKGRLSVSDEHGFTVTKVECSVGYQ